MDECTHIIYEYTHFLSTSVEVECQYSFRVWRFQFLCTRGTIDRLAGILNQDWSDTRLVGGEGTEKGTADFVEPRNCVRSLKFRC